MSLLLAALFFAAPVPTSPPVMTVAPAALRFWKPSEGRVEWVSDGVRIAIAPAPCETPPQTEGCRFDGFNNQAELTVTAPGAPPYRVLGNNQASYYRVGVVRFEPGDARPGVVIENESGGSGGDVWVQLLVPSPTGYRELRLPGALQGALPHTLSDISGDGRIDFVLGDGRFDSAFGCNACSPRPPVVLTVRGGAIVDVSREPAFAPVFRKDMARLRPICASTTPDRNGACAAYVADAARIGEFKTAWALMLKHWEKAPAGRDFPTALRAFLHRTGYAD